MNEVIDRNAEIAYGQVDTVRCEGVTLHIPTHYTSEETQKALKHLLWIMGSEGENAALDVTIANMRQVLKEAEATEQEIKAYKNDVYWGLCPVCRNPSDCVLNVVKDHYAICNNCRTFWSIGYNLFSGWKYESEATWQKNDALLATYRKVKPIHVSTDTETDICHRCGVNNQATHHFLCQARDGTPTPYSDDEVKAMIRGLNLGLRHYGIRNPELDDDQIEF